jgi:hypothetical protein
MRDVAIGVLAAIVISSGVAYWMRQSSDAETRDMLKAQQAQLDALRSGVNAIIQGGRPTQVTIQVSSAGGGKCTSTTVPKVPVYGANRVFWHVWRPGPNTSTCFANGETVKIKPKPGNTSPLSPPMPFDSALISADVVNHAQSYFYEVWMADSKGVDLYKMEDPELEIIETIKIPGSGTP